MSHAWFVAEHYCKQKTKINIVSEIENFPYSLQRKQKKTFFENLNLGVLGTKWIKCLKLIKFIAMVYVYSGGAVPLSTDSCIQLFASSVSICKFSKRIAVYFFYCHLWEFKNLREHHGNLQFENFIVDQPVWECTKRRFVLWSLNSIILGNSDT